MCHCMQEVCLVARKDGPTTAGTHCGLRNDVICSQRRGQSQKPEEIYELIEDLVPNGKQLATLYKRFYAANAATCVQAEMLPHCSNLCTQPAGSHISSNATDQPLLTAGCYLEIFGRQNNLRNYWVTVGNEVSGSTTPPAPLTARLEELRALRPGT